MYKSLTKPIDIRGYKLKTREDIILAQVQKEEALETNIEPFEPIHYDFSGPNRGVKAIIRDFFKMFTI